ncbi:MAG TPA: Stk1 family PASTA domain-containing Ser/Thr kinase [Propionibacteriaceae bacterium]|nr:Stk1 family PASTA domain-containing Ser/Thr kinase [Propionibacteriaceae bacterium]
MNEPTVLGGRYHLEAIIGRGGMAEVWRARDSRLGREVAVKRLRVDLATDPTFQARFRREAQSAAGLNHPNIVSTYDTGEEDDPATGIGVPFIVMELVAGHTLRDLLRDGRRILPERALEFSMGVLDALAYSHKAGIIHRDIKPANVMLTPQGVVKVMDFGIARAVADTSATMTQTAAVIGTASYLSPEQARGETVDHRSDIYSAGCLLYELLTGRPPFVGDSPVSVAYQHVRENPVPPSQLDPQLTADMDAIVLKSLAKDPANRYADAREMRDDIARLLSGQTVTAVIPAAVAVVPEATALTTALPTTDAPDEPIVPLDADEEPERSKSPVVPWLIGALVLALVAALGFGVWEIMRPGDGTDVVMVEVPPVRGTTLLAATQVLEVAGLVPVEKHVEGPDDSTKGNVTEQDPDAGQQVERGSSVTITINDGPKLATIPTGIKGRSEDAARAALTAAGFTNVTVEQGDPATEPITAKKDTVVELDPAEGFEGVPTTPVTIYLATGRSVVPNLQGFTVEEATQKAKEAGFIIDVKQAESTNTPNLIFRQAPSPGNVELRSVPIVVTVAKAPIVPTFTPSAPETSTPPTSAAPSETAPATSKPAASATP